MKAFFAGSVLFFCLAVPGRGLAADVPSLDEMAGEWMPLSIVTNLPDVHNFNQMVIVEPRSDLVLLQSRRAVFPGCRPAHPMAGGLPAGENDARRRRVPRHRLPLVCVSRPAAQLGLRGLVGGNRHPHGERADGACSVASRSPTPPKCRRKSSWPCAFPASWTRTARASVNATQNPRTTCALAAFAQARRRRRSKATMWYGIGNCKLAAGGTADVGYVAGDGSARPSRRDAEKRRGLGAPVRRGDGRFQGHLEQALGGRVHAGQYALFGQPAGPQDGRRCAAAQLLHGRADDARSSSGRSSRSSRAFITSGERSEGIQYFWDASMQATAWALLEPEGDEGGSSPLAGAEPAGQRPYFNLRDAAGFDAKHYDAIDGYAANACTMFETADTYLRVTGDRDFPGRQAGERKNRPRKSRRAGHRLGDAAQGAGGVGELRRTTASCWRRAAMYVECVAAVNAQNVWMMREAAEWQSFKGNEARAKELRDKADGFSARGARRFTTRRRARGTSAGWTGRPCRCSIASTTSTWRTRWRMT